MNDHDHKAVAHRAKWVLVDPGTVISDGYVLVQAGKVVEAGGGKISPDYLQVDHGSGVLMPGTINAHTHLELCALQGKVPWTSGFRGWVKKLLEERQVVGEKMLELAAYEGIQQLEQTGCAAVGDISTLGLTLEPLAKSGLGGVWFQEVLGNLDNVFLEKSERKNRKFDETAHNKKPISGPAPVHAWAVHAPHTTSPELIEALFSRCNEKGVPLSVHLAESQDETEFITTAKGPWADFLRDRGIDFSGWALPAKSPVSHMAGTGVLNRRTLVVHLLEADREDLETLRKEQVKICLCPRSNQNLHGKLPDLERMLSMGFRPCLGTDSPASVDSLNIFHEMAFTARMYPNVTPREILTMGTVNGAEALGISDRFGSLSKGRWASMAYLPIGAKRPSEVIAAIVENQFSKEKRVFCHEISK